MLYKDNQKISTSVGTLATISSRSSVVKKEPKATKNPKINQEKCVCPVCEEEIVDVTGKKSGQEAIECEGSRAMWLHRGCASLSEELTKISVVQISHFTVHIVG